MGKISKSTLYRKGDHDLYLETYYIEMAPIVSLYISAVREDIRT